MIQRIVTMRVKMNERSMKGNPKRNSRGLQSSSHMFVTSFSCTMKHCRVHKAYQLHPELQPLNFSRAISLSLSLSLSHTHTHTHIVSSDLSSKSPILVSTKTEHENPMMGRLKIMGSLSAFLQQGEAQQLLQHLPCLSCTQVPWN
jgi:hypothetical protein